MWSVTLGGSLQLSMGVLAGVAPLEQKGNMLRCVSDIESMTCSSSSWLGFQWWLQFYHHPHQWKGRLFFCNCDLPLQRWVLSIFYLEIWGYIYGFKMIVVYSSIENIFSMFFYLNCSLLYGNSLAFLKSFFHLRKSELIVTLMSFKTEDLIHSTSVDTVHSTSCLALRNSQNICENNCRLFSTLPMYRHGVLFLHRFNVLFGD